VVADGFPTGAAWGDYDRDGLLDLYVTRYTHLNVSRYGPNDPWCNFLGIQVFCGPWNFPGETDLLFHNKGHGQFEEVGKKAGVSNEQNLHGMQAVWTDLDNDGWPDLYVANDRGGNYLFHNKHDGTFEETGILSGASVSAAARQQGSMGVAVSDFLHDGNFSIFVTNFQQESDTLYRGLGGDLGFEDTSTAAGITRFTFPFVGWGTGFADFINSGWDDLLIANGHIYPQIDEGHMQFTYREPLLYLHNNRDGKFSDFTSLSKLDTLPPQSRRGMAFGEIANDGRQDVLILNDGAPPTLLLNCTRNAGHAVLLKLIGTRSNRSAIGARIRVMAGDMKQMSEVRSGESYLSSNDLRQHFGLGSNAKIDSIEIDWPSGTKQSLKDLAADFIYTVEEGTGIRKSEPFAALPDACNERPSTADAASHKK
jgi:enediyne biosynthesis protein E4